MEGKGWGIKCIGTRRELRLQVAMSCYLVLHSSVHCSFILVLGLALILLPTMKEAAQLRRSERVTRMSLDKPRKLACTQGKPGINYIMLAIQDLFVPQDVQDVMPALTYPIYPHRRVIGEKKISTIQSSYRAWSMRLPVTARNGIVIVTTVSRTEGEPGLRYSSPAIYDQRPSDVRDFLSRGSANQFPAKWLDVRIVERAL